VSSTSNEEVLDNHADHFYSPIAFHPASVVFDTPSHAELLEKVGVRPLITGVIDELVALASVQGCHFRGDFREQTMEQMILPTETHSIMYQDYTARRPMEVETYLGSPMKLAQEVDMQVPRIETLYALLHNTNVLNQTRPQQQAPASPGAQQPLPPRMSSAPGPGPRGMSYGPGPMNGPPMRPGVRSGSRAPSATGGPPPHMRRGPPSMNGYPPPRMNGNGYGPRGPPQQMSRRPSFEGNDLQEFSHVMLYDDMPEGEPGYEGMPPPGSNELALRERELALRQKELALREREFGMRRGAPPRMPPPPRRQPSGYDDDDEDGEDYFDPMAGAPPMNAADAENLDMMSVTSRRTRKAPSASQFRSNPEMGSMGPPRQNRTPWKRPPTKSRTSATIMGEMPNLREELMSNPLMGYSSDRYGNVDRHNLGQESRTNSLTAERLNELQKGPPSGHQNGPPMSRRGSQSPGNPLSPGARQQPGRRHSPPNGYNSHHGPGLNNGRPSPPGMMRQPVPRHPPGHGNAVAPSHIEQQGAATAATTTTTGVSHLYPPKSGPHHHQIRSLTGSASASAGSGESNRSAPLDSEPSAHSSSSSLGPRGGAPIGVR